MNVVRKFIIIVILLITFLFVSGIGLYYYFIKPVDNNASGKIIKIESPASATKIGQILYKNKLIKNDKFFSLYIKLNKINNLQAGTYKLSSNMPLKDIVSIISEGKIYKDDTIRITFREGINFREFAKVVEKNTTNSYDEVIESLSNKDYLKGLIEDYWFITDEILNDEIYYPLEGYLFPDTYEFINNGVTTYEIAKKLLDQMDVVLTPYKNLIENDKYSVHELLTLASIAEKESNNNRKNVVSVFVNRLNKNISLGSDITTRYGIKLDDSRPLTKSEYASINPYNTRNTNMVGLPASPICMVSKDSIEASINRIETNYLYFIANINTRETFFYATSKEFEAKKQELSKVNGGY